MNYEDFKRMIVANATIYFDANCLLSLYRQPTALVQSFISAMDDMENSFRLSPIAGEEIKRNQKKKREENAQQFYNITKTLNDGLSKFDNNIKIIIKEFNRINKKNTSDKIKEIQEQIGEKTSLLKKELENITAEELKNSIHNDMVDKFVERCLDSTNIIPELPEDVKIQQMIEGYIRSKHNYPPGFMDFKEKYHKRKANAAKNNNGYLSVDNLTDYLGDYLIWYDVIHDKPEDDKIFVTNDLKEDWWENPKNQDSLENLKPRKELLKEFHSHNQDSEIIFITFDLFIYYISIYFSKEPFIAYFISNTLPILYTGIESSCEDKLKSFLDDSMIFDTDLNNGLKVQEYNIELVDFNINNYQIVEIIDYENPEYAHKELVVNVEFKVQAKGLFNFELGLERETFEYSSGTFQLKDGIITTQIKLIYHLHDTSSVELEDINELIESVEVSEQEIEFNFSWGNFIASKYDEIDEYDFNPFDLV